MMSANFEQQRLQPGFTFRIVEIVKHIKIQPTPSKPLLPLGLSAATGIVLTVMMFSSYMISLTPFGALLGSPLPSETKVMTEGELPVDVLDISEITFLSGEKGDDDGGIAKIPSPQNAFAPTLAPSGKNTWIKKTDMPTARFVFAASAVNGKIYVIGGAPNLVGPISIVEEYGVIADKWTKKVDMPTARQSFSASTVNGKIYAIGGWAGAGRFLSIVEEYDAIQNKWTKKTDMPTARSELSTSVVNGKIYAIGGGRPRGLSTVEEYDPATDKWTEKTDMPTARASLSTSVVNGKIYAIGGTVSATGGPAFSTVEEYDPATDKWMKKGDMPTARMSFSTSMVNGKIYVIGGVTAGLAPTSTVEEYYPGFTGQSIDTEGKLPTTWGDVKAGK